MALDSMEVVLHQYQIAREYDSIKRQADRIKDGMTEVVADGTAFHSKVGADADLTPQQIADVQAFLVALKSDLVAHANAL